MSTRKYEAEYKRRCAVIMDFLVPRMGRQFTTAQIAAALNTSQSRIQNTLSAMNREREISARKGQIHTDGHVGMLWWLDAIATKASAPSIRTLWRPLRPARCSVVPVRAGGRMAPVVCDDPRIGMGHWARNEFSPTEAFK